MKTCHWILLKTGWCLPIVYRVQVTLLFLASRFPTWSGPRLLPSLSSTLVPLLFVGLFFNSHMVGFFLSTRSLTLDLIRKAFLGKFYVTFLFVWHLKILCIISLSALFSVSLFISGSSSPDKHIFLDVNLMKIRKCQIYSLPWLA
jgi:hypothetical protein